MQSKCGRFDSYTASFRTMNGHWKQVDLLPSPPTRSCLRLEDRTIRGSQHRSPTMPPRATFKDKQPLKTLARASQSCAAQVSGCQPLQLRATPSHIRPHSFLNPGVAHARAGIRFELFLYLRRPTRHPHPILPRLTPPFTLALGCDTQANDPVRRVRRVCWT